MSATGHPWRAAWGALTDVPGLTVGQVSHPAPGALTGVTVVLPPPGTVGGVDVRGGGPATHETDALAVGTLVATVDAICLSGGSAYGLAAAGGVQAWCEAAGRGFGVGPPDDPRALLVPIVPAAAVFDLGRGGDPSIRPDAALGRAAAAGADAAAGAAPAVGRVGAGTGALLAGGALAGGVGTASVLLDVAAGHVVVGALVVANALGSPVDPADGALLGRAHLPPGVPRPGVPSPAEADALRTRLVAAARPVTAPAAAPAVPRANTTLAVVATDARLDVAATTRLAASGHDGLARTLAPVHTLLDGDLVFGLATPTVSLEPLELVAVQAAAAIAVTLAVLDAVLSASAVKTPAIDVPGYLDLCPSATP